MPQVQTYATCDRQTLSDVLIRYREALVQLGCADQRVIRWLSAISWPSTDDDGYGDIYASPFVLSPPHVEPVTCAGMDVSLYIHSALPSVEELPVWVGINLLFDTRSLKDDAVSPYNREAGRTLWMIVSTLAGMFRELGVYFTSEWQENLSWRALAEGEGDPWAFDLAIFPRELAPSFKEVPPGFQGTVIDQGFGFALENRWRILPWKAAEPL